MKSASRGRHGRSAFRFDSGYIEVYRDGSWRPVGRSVDLERLESAGHVCLREIGDSGLKGLLRPHAKRVTCGVCGRRRLGVALDELVARVDKVYKALFVPGRVDTYEQDDGSALALEYGRTAPAIVASLAKLHPKLARPIVERLALNQVVRKGESPAYSLYGHFVGRSVSGGGHMRPWDLYCQRVLRDRDKAEEVADEMLPEILGDLSKLAPTPVLALNPSEKLLFRARVVRDWDKAVRVKREGERELAAPPVSVAQPGRMSLPGVPAFYAAFLPGTALAEARADVGDFVVIGCFKLIRPVRLFDLAPFTASPDLGSPFEGDYLGRCAQAVFLRAFQHQVSAPLPSWLSSLGYLPTQLLCRHVSRRLRLDGIVYPSHRDGTTRSMPADWQSMNVALFDGPAMAASTGSDRPAAKLAFVDAHIHVVTSLTIAHERVDSEPRRALFDEHRAREDMHGLAKADAAARDDLDNDRFGPSFEARVDDFLSIADDDDGGAVSSFDDDIPF
jgi:hypothetical protein